MGENSAIEWCDHTFNPWIGCTKVSAGCTNCYAEADQDKRRGRVQWGKGQLRSRTSVLYWKQPIKWNNEARDTGTRPRVFCASLADVFDEEVPTGWLEDLFTLIRQTPNLDWLLLTKRPNRIMDRVHLCMIDFMHLGSKCSADIEWLSNWMLGKAPRNVTLGTTVEHPDSMNRIHALLECAARTRFLSCEPLVAGIDLQYYFDLCQRNGKWLPRQPHCPDRIDWVIAGGESGPHARPSHPDWIRILRDQCAAAKVPFLFKQWGEWLPYEPEEAPFWKGQHGGIIDSHAFGPYIGEHVPTTGKNSFWCPWVDCDVVFRKAGKVASGRLLDGQLHNAFPSITSTVSTPSTESRS